MKEGFKTIFARIWAIWGILAFIGTMLVFMIPFLLFCYFLKEPKRTKRFIAYSRVWMAIYLFIIGCPLRIRGKEHFKPGAQYIVLCNHNSFMDIPVSSPSIPGGNKTIAKDELAKIPLFGLIYKAGSILVNRKSDQSRKESYQKMKSVLEMGLHMCIYPEGTRNKQGGAPGAFHNGAFRLSMETGRSIIPAVIFHTAKVLPSSKIMYLWPHRLEIHFLPPVDPGNGYTMESLKREVHHIMSDYYLAGGKAIGGI